MLRIALLTVASLAAAAPAWAQGDAPPPPDPERQALTYELQECVGSRLRTTTQLFAMKAQLDAATKRADEAEAKLKAADSPPPK